MDERETASLKSKESASVASVPSHAAEAILLTEARDGGIFQNVRINRFYDHTPNGIYAESSVIAGSLNRGANSPALSDRHIYRRKHHSDFNTGCSLDPDVNDILTFGDHALHNGHSIASNLSSRAGSSSFRETTPLKLSSLQELIKQFPHSREDDEDQNDSELCVETELRNITDHFDRRGNFCIFLLL